MPEFTVAHLKGKFGWALPQESHRITAHSGLEAIRACLPPCDQVGKSYDQWNPEELDYDKSVIWSPHVFNAKGYNTDFWVASELSIFPAGCATC